MLKMNPLKICILLAVTGFFSISAVNPDKSNKDFCSAFEKTRAGLSKLLSTHGTGSSTELKEKDLFPGAVSGKPREGYVLFTMYIGSSAAESLKTYEDIIAGLKECKPAGWEEDEYSDEELSMSGFIIYDKQYLESEGKAGNSVSVSYEYPYYEEEDTYTVDLIFSGQ